jgi:hypothetical protein
MAGVRVYAEGTARSTSPCPYTRLTSSTTL